MRSLQTQNAKLDKLSWDTLIVIQTLLIKFIPPVSKLDKTKSDSFKAHFDCVGAHSSSHKIREDCYGFEEKSYQTLLKFDKIHSHHLNILKSV